MDRPGTDGRGKVAWAIVGMILIAIVVYDLYSFVGAVVVGVFLYYATRPLYRWLAKRIDHSDLNGAVTLLLVGLPLLIVLGYAVLIGAREAQQFLDAGGLDRFQVILRPYIDGSLPSGGGSAIWYGAISPGSSESPKPPFPDRSDSASSA